MRLQLFQVDAFTSHVFSGNPAAICPLRTWLPDHRMQQIAAENNLSETAFFVPKGSDFDLRWFTPACEVDLCGHATLASAYVLWALLGDQRDCLRFHTQSGALQVRKQGDLLTLELPVRAPEVTAVHPGLVRALGGALPLEILAARDYLVRYASAEDVLALAPDFSLLAGMDRFAVIATAPASDGQIDFVSRFFAPAQGINEDPATGSSHSTLVPYWAKQLGKTDLKAQQLSKRGADFACRLADGRVFLSGNAVLYLQGEIIVPDTL